MGEKSKIEWTDATWNPIRARQTVPGVAFKPKIGWHCEHVSEGCRNCYAETMNRRLGTGLDFKPGHRSDVEIFLDEKMLLAPLRWTKPRRIFVNSMTDTFAEFVKDEWLDRMFAVMALAARHTFQVLTKRPERMREFCTSGWPLPNVWLGVSAEDQATADERIPLLLETPAAVRFVSLEPLLGPIDLFHIEEPSGLTFNALSKKEGISFRGRGLDWAIVGGESGPHARPMHPEWARDIRDQCAAAATPFFFKQWGEWAGRLLDGREHNGMPGDVNV
jgi:protein gp37